MLAETIEKIDDARGELLAEIRTAPIAFARDLLTVANFLAWSVDRLADRMPGVSPCVVCEAARGSCNCWETCVCGWTALTLAGFRRAEVNYYDAPGCTNPACQRVSAGS